LQLYNFSGRSAARRGVALPFTRRRPHLKAPSFGNGGLKWGDLVQRFPGATPIGPDLDVYVVAATYSDRREISLAKAKFRLRNDFVSPDPRKVLKSLGREISSFSVSCDFKGLRPVFFRAFLSPSVFRSARQA